MLEPKVLEPKLSNWELIIQLCNECKDILSILIKNSELKELENEQARQEFTR